MSLFIVALLAELLCVVSFQPTMISFKLQSRFISSSGSSGSRSSSSSSSSSSGSSISSSRNSDSRTALYATAKKKKGGPVLPEFSRVLNVGQVTMQDDDDDDDDDEHTLLSCAILPQP